jgi:hypothetical protein
MKTFFFKTPQDIGGAFSSDDTPDIANPATIPLGSMSATEDPGFEYHRFPEGAKPNRNPSG